MQRQYEEARRILSSNLRKQNIKNAKEQRQRLLEIEREKNIQNLVKWDLYKVAMARRKVVEKILSD